MWVLIEIENEYANKVNTILQLRYHEAIIELKNKIDNADPQKTFIDLTYITSRGVGIIPLGKDESKSEDCHQYRDSFFRYANLIFGPCEDFTITEKTKDTNAGTLKLKKANVNWYLSINSDNLPKEIKNQKLTTFRTLKIENEEIEFSKGFTDLHTLSYQNILSGNGYGLKDAMNSIEEIINSKIKMKFEGKNVLVIGEWVLLVLCCFRAIKISCQ